MITLFVIGYFAVGVALFFGFWRWVALEGDDSTNSFVSLSLLFLWPVSLGTIGSCILIDFILNCGRRVMKK